MDFEEVKACRLCASTEPFESIIDLGEQFIANAFHPKDDPPTLKAPLHLGKCKSCDLVQLYHSIDPNLMYKNYYYKSGMNDTMRNHLKSLIEDIKKRIIFFTGEAVIDIGSNDWTLLDCYPNNLVRVGVDPSNIQRPSTSFGVFLNDYYTDENMNRVMGPCEGYNRKDKARIITSIAMFYDLSNPKKFVKDIRARLQDDGIWIAELSYLPLMLEKTAFDSVCHEHVCFYRLKTFIKTLEDTDLEVFDILFNDINGGSFRVYVAPKGSQTVNSKVAEVLAIEEIEFADNYHYKNFTENTIAEMGNLKGFLFECKKRGDKVYGIGGSTKGQIILQYAGINENDIVAIAERNPDKIDLYTPGSNIRIASEQEMREAKPDYVLVFPYYFETEILEREKELFNSGTKFVLPLPEFRIVSRTDPEFTGNYN